MKLTWIPPFFVSTGKFDLNSSSTIVNERNDNLVADKNKRETYRNLEEYEFKGATEPVHHENREDGAETEKKGGVKARTLVSQKPGKKNCSSGIGSSYCSASHNKKHCCEKTDFCRAEKPSDKSKKAIFEKRTSNQKRVGVSAGSLDELESKNRAKENVVAESANEQLTISKAADVGIPKYGKSEESEKLIKSAIMNNEFLREGMISDKEVMQAVMDSMYMQKVSENSFIIREGEIGKSFSAGSHLYVCAEGLIEVYKEGKKVNTLGPGRIFGELALLYNTRRNATIKAMTQCTLWVLDRKAFNQIVRNVGMKRIEERVKYLRSVPILAALEKEVLIKIAELLKTRMFSAGTHIIKQGEEGNLFYIISVGTVIVTVKHSDGSEKAVEKLEKGEFFGEGALMAKDKRTATVTARTDVECLILDREPFIEFLGGLKEVQDVIKRRNAKLKNVKEEISEYSHIKLEDLEVKGTLGLGGFGRVELVEYRTNPKLTFALKRLKKNHIVEFQQEHHVINEKTTMLCCHSPFIAKLHNTYKDPKYLYFLMEACLGGDVWTLLQKRKSFDEKAARFITGCVVEAFQYLHDRGIVYRDLKPENLLFDGKGYVKLVDFGFAKKLGHTEKTWTFAGTPEYLAPEIILNKGHDRAVDYWALGVFIYELLVGNPPFRGSDQMKTYGLILKGINAVTFPKFISKSAELLIKKLCKNEPTERLGYQKDGVEGIKFHKWFGDFNWVSLEKTEMKAPIVPKISGPTDRSNFDDCPKDKEVPPDDFGDWDAEF